MAAHSEPLGPKKRLDSWKEIAAFFGRDERTVKRWEKERGLPVYRVPGSARGGVFAYAEELAEWLKAPNVALEVVAESAAESRYADESSERVAAIELATDKAAEVPKRERDTKIDPVSSVPSSFPLPIRGPIPVPISAASPSRFAAARPFLWMIPLALIVGTFLIFSLGHREPRFKNALAAPHAPSAEAQDLYLKGRYYFEKRTPDDLNKAVDFFTQAIVHDPGYAAPYVGLADTYNLLREYSAMPPQEAFPRARAAASKAVELDPNSAEGHNSLAFASFWGFYDAATAEREFTRALELDPTSPRVHHWHATFLVEIGRIPEALAEIERARQLDPSSTPILADKGLILAAAGKKEEARALLTQLTASQPDFIHAHGYLAEHVYFPEGNYAGYFQEKKIVARLRHDAGAEQAIDAEEKGYNRDGLQGLLEARLATAQDLFNRGLGTAFDVAEGHAALGENDDAMKYLQLAYQRHDLMLVTLGEDHWFKPLHQEKEFRELVVKIGLPPIN
jgi:tetratricopeptide (TPR) repeat protein